MHKDCPDNYLIPSYNIRKFIFYTASAIYASFCFLLLAFNSLLISNENNNSTDEGQVRTFHVLEFTIPYLYCLVMILVIYRVEIAENEKMIHRIIQYVEQGSLFMQLLSGLISALLIYVAQEEFETVGHYLEYSSFILLALVDIMLVIGCRDIWWKKALSLVLVIVSILAIIALFVMRSKNLEFKTHFLEFSVELVLILGSVIAVTCK
jgi:hypothetical protein